MHTPITDVGLKELTGLKNLRNLDLTSTKVTDEGLKELGGREVLEEVKVSSTSVTAAGKAGLKKALPKCVVE
jgi:hypothetical protein